MSPLLKMKQTSNTLDAMAKAGLNVDIFDSERNQMAIINTPKNTKQVIERCFCWESWAMKSLGYKIYRGSMYKKDKGSMYTYGYKCSAANWFGALEGNVNFREDLVKPMNLLRERLSPPEASGKTSLFTSIRAIVPTHRIGKITKQSQFNKAMMSKHCEVMFHDEATADLMDIDDNNLQLSMCQKKQCVPYTKRNLEQNNPNLSVWERCVACR